MGPPSAPRHPDRRGVDNQGKGLGDPPGPLNPEEDMEVPGTPRPGRSPGTPPRANLHMREEDKLASPRWKLPEDLGAKKMEAPWGTEMEKLLVSVRLPGKGGRLHLTPLRRIIGREEATSPPKKNPEGFSRQNPSSPKGAPVVSP